jgi:hypothetical protein
VVEEQISRMFPQNVRCVAREQGIGNR